MTSAPIFRGFNDHPRLEGTHALLSPSNYHWMNDTEDKFLRRLENAEAAARGTSLHALAAHAIREGVLLHEDREKGENLTLALFVNDAIKFEMIPERYLVYSENCYGQTDAIGFKPEIMFLRIHDFKSGVTPASEKQLFIYAAYFCLEYGFGPYEINGELRIYQSNEVRIYDLDRNLLAYIMDKIVLFDRIIEERKLRGLT